MGYRAGKTSILNVLFNKLPPKQTFFLETTIRITKHTFECVRSHLSFFGSADMNATTSTVIPLEIWDCPGNITVEDLGTSLSEFSSLIFVIDIRVSDSRRQAAKVPDKSRVSRICTNNRYQSLSSLLLLLITITQISISKCSCTKLRRCRTRTSSVRLTIPMELLPI